MPSALFAKCTPPFRGRENVDALWSYVADGTIDVLGTDHGPFTDEEKGQEGDFWKEYCGFGCNDAVMAAMVTEGIHKRGLSWNRLASLTSGNAARMFGSYPQKGNLLPGADADIQIIDPNQEWIYDGLKSYSKTKSSKGAYQERWNTAPWSCRIRHGHGAVYGQQYAHRRLASPRPAVCRLWRHGGPGHRPGQ